MVTSSIFIGMGIVILLALSIYGLFQKLTHQVAEQTESFLLRFGKIERILKVPGLYFLPQKVLPWYELISVSKQIDYRNFKGIQVNDRNGTTIIVDLWMEFRITDTYKALFSVESWEEVLESVVIHSTASILCSQSIEEILKHRTELSEHLKQSIEAETARWGLSLHTAMIQNIGLRPEISKQFFQSVAARIERTTALIQEEGRLQVAKLEASTAYKIAELNGLSRSQLPMEIGKFYQSLSTEPQQQKKFIQYWELMNLDPKKTVTVSGFSSGPLEIIEATKAVESILTH